MLRCCRNLALLLCLGLLATRGAFAEEAKPLTIYFIDVEGGAAMLMITPERESVLIDSGYPDFQDRDRDRILKVAREVEGLSRIDHAVVSHWHLDHYGNHAALAAVLPIGTFWDRGVPDALPEDKDFETRIAAYRAASQNQSRVLRAGDQFPLRSGKTPLAARVLTASRDVIANAGEPNPFADEHQPQPDDPSDNAASISLLLEFGAFRFLCCGDLTWNVEAQLVTPLNPVGLVDLFMVTHHGLQSSNNPVFVRAIDPVTAVMCNGPRKGGHPQTIATLRSVKSLQDWYQLHRNVALEESEQAPPEFIANHGGTEGCAGVWVKAVVAADGRSYTLQIGPDGPPRRYESRHAESR